MNEPQSGALAELRDDAASRKAFLRLAGGGAAGGLAVLLAACGTTGESSSGTTSQEETGKDDSSLETAAGDLEILNFALTLEYLESDFYAQVLDAKIIKDSNLAGLVTAIGAHEREHVEALMVTIESLGGTPVAPPKTRFESVLDGGPETVLQTAATVENLGAAAYLGQAPRIKDPEVLAAALSIHSVEARHAAALNELAGRAFAEGDPLEGSIPDGPFAQPMDMDAVLAAVKPYIA